MTGTGKVSAGGDLLLAQYIVRCELFIGDQAFPIHLVLEQQRFQIFRLAVHIQEIAVLILTIQAKLLGIELCGTSSRAVHRLHLDAIVGNIGVLYLFQRGDHALFGLHILRLDPQLLHNILAGKVHIVGGQIAASGFRILHIIEIAGIGIPMAIVFIAVPIHHSGHHTEIRGILLPQIVQRQKQAAIFHRQSFCGDHIVSNDIGKAVGIDEHIQLFLVAEAVRNGYAGFLQAPFIELVVGWVKGKRRPVVPHEPLQSNGRGIGFPAGAGQRGSGRGRLAFRCGSAYGGRCTRFRAGCAGRRTGAAAQKPRDTDNRKHCFPFFQHFDFPPY